jgi:hypothetical protein
MELEMGSVRDMLGKERMGKGDKRQDVQSGSF